MKFNLRASYYDKNKKSVRGLSNARYVVIFYGGFKIIDYFSFDRIKNVSKKKAIVDLLRSKSREIIRDGLSSSLQYSNALKKKFRIQLLDESGKKTRSLKKAFFFNIYISNNLVFELIPFGNLKTTEARIKLINEAISYYFSRIDFFEEIGRREDTEEEYKDLVAQEKLIPTRLNKRFFESKYILAEEGYKYKTVTDLYEKYNILTRVNSEKFKREINTYQDVVDLKEGEVYFIRNEAAPESEQTNEYELQMDNFRRIADAHIQMFWNRTRNMEFKNMYFRIALEFKNDNGDVMDRSGISYKLYDVAEMFPNSPKAYHHVFKVFNQYMTEAFALVMERMKNYQLTERYTRIDVPRIILRGYYDQ